MNVKLQEDTKCEILRFRHKQKAEEKQLAFSFLYDLTFRR